ncbi:phospho-N-acetylmuramoyl-pentapeptide-transferase [Candidatus Thioglobus sp.]|jgi:phospho-N-acetylmuramoyl-pentapeptide-transferase|uniref:phospho-N-acetylmuramoyl-pentapeptide- transferase n=1 Tax=Candidatus Pseudothioglobus sp. Uisw_016 TaxID=3230995 RepID=UPI002303B46E|nr:phospho-N-acetylmuramoyl-pentapeptide-transferase [Candidatus Thioglobus sp.]MDA8905426.1 phospho-N-acetylmuramoyl-pentapeptide-transferase [Candidatus Thioglobus sp.]MDA9060312.1 phospho-N-acetylmuramoyl-pentapeptide-transferase [Candidatus Thioglobus sp.]MDB4026660.1 phospho-N-acetylmuramoyl-pentapeptide-transferase [Candidatus Thioglobus sp.]MDB4057183.1 phospho-N-acetylmuramoyl-pentapeptide-transferase [Candidatus Thioglobus sp.]MDB4139492.1 phospho-N-acetylmuramoyl-pentapeptide-transfe
MFLEILSFLSSLDTGFNVLSYLTVRAVFAMMTALLITLVLGKWIISKLQHYQIGQVIRNDGPETHLEKAGTPTMGGVLILFAFFISVLIWGDWDNPFLWIVIVTALLFSAIGFIDDYLKIKKQNSDGLSRRQKILAQSISAILICVWLLSLNSKTIGAELLIPFFKDLIIPLNALAFLIIGWFALVGSSNSVNLTDGLDGLAIMPVILISGALAVFAYIGGNYNFSGYLNMPFMPGTGEIFVLCAALVGAGFGFLWFNTYPAEIFMGDTGSLSLGAILGVIAIIVHQEILLILMGGIFVAETLSVIIQIGYFKRTQKRIFLMAPLHHHYEKKGLKEPKIIVRFWIITLILVLISLASIKIR